MLSQRRAPGFSIIELMVGLTIVGVLIAIGAPSFATYLQSSKLASASQSYLSGVQLARAEAIRRNLPVQFVLTDTPIDTPDIANSAAPSVSGQNWVVRAASGATFAPIEAKAAIEGAFTGTGTPSVQIDGTANPTVFDGTISFNGFGGTSDGSAYELNLQNPSGGACAPAGPMRCPRIRIPRGGQVALCDPLFVAASDSRGC